MAVLKLNCTNQMLSWESDPTELFSGNVKIDKVEFKFCELWQDCTKTAVFHRDRGEPYHVLLDDDDSCFIPPEVVLEAGTIYIGVFGVHDGCRRTSSEVSFVLGVGAVTDGTISDPTPDIYAQIIQLLDEIPKFDDYVGRKSLGQGSEVFNDYKRNIAGIKGYYYSGIDFSGEQPVITFAHEQGVAPEEPFTIDYEVGDVISIVTYRGHFTNCSTIVDIQDNVVTVDSLPFKELEILPNTTYDDWSVFVIAKPEVGPVSLGWYAHAEGENTKCYERSGHTEGRDTEVIGQYGHAQNRGCVADYCSFAGGLRSMALAKYAFVFGIEAFTKTDKQIVLGNYNLIDELKRYLYILGNGYEGNRSNAHTIDWSGTAWFKGDVKVGGTNQDDAKTLATLNDVDAKLSELLNTKFGTYAVQDLVQDITCEMTVKLDYPVAVDSFAIVVEGTIVGEKSPIGSPMRIAKELLSAENARVVFYAGKSEVYTTKILHTIPNAGMLMLEN